PALGSSTSTAVKETRCCRAVRMAWLILAASAGREDDVQTGGTEGAAPAAGAGAAPGGPGARRAAQNGAKAASRDTPGRTGSRRMGPPAGGGREGADHTVPASGRAGQYPAPDTPAAAATGAI